MGIGIVMRRDRAKTYWEKHISLCKEFQRTALSAHKWGGSGSIAVLGAGHLFDIDLELLTDKFEKIALFDANPSLREFWRKKAANHRSREIRFNIIDISGGVSGWSTELRGKFRSAQIRTVSELIQYLDGLRVQPVEIGRFDYIFSVNLLSQIAVYWRDRAHELILRYLKIDTDRNGEYEAALQAALAGSMRRLEEEHLALLARSAARGVLLCSDTEIYYYKHEQAEWQIEQALRLSERIRVSGFSEKFSDSWLWHIAPQGVEQRDFGIIHRVETQYWCKA